MPSYRSFGGLDDQPLIDGDGGFVGMNQREQPHQLPAGEVVLSQNGRMEGYWQPRKGIALKSGALSSSSLPLKVPFIVLDTALTVATASRTSDVVTVNFAAPHGIDAANFPAYITLGVPSNSTEPIAGIPAGAYLFSYVDADSLSFANVGADDPALVVDATYGVMAAILDDNAVSAIFGSCVWSDPTNNLAETIILATNNEAKKVALDGYAVTALKYPYGATATGAVDMIQAFDRIYLFREGQRAWEYIPNGRNVEAGAYVSGTGVVTLTLREHGFTAGDTVTVSGVGFSAAPVTADPNGTHVVATVPDANTFTYVIATGSGDETYTANTGKVVSAGFSLVPSGTYTQPQYFVLAGNKFGAASGTVRFTVTGNTTIRVGDTIKIGPSDVAELEELNGNSYVVTAATATDIYFKAPVPDVTYGSGAGSDFIEFGGRFSQGLGFTHMPAPPWAVYFQRRLWCPYYYDVSGTYAAPVFTDRKKRDEIAASDILDSNTFDSILSQFRVTPGVADYIVGIHPFYNDNMLVLNRNSIHMITGTQGTLSDTVLRELTREVGCLARKSIVSQGNNVFFLSDNGVYGLSFIDEYNLRGVEKPLSEKIQPFINRINKRLADGAVGTYFENRYYLAVPLDSIAGRDDAKGNNAVLVYNMLNKGWESIDTFGNANFNIINFLHGQDGSRNELYLINDAGGLHLADATELPRDYYSVTVTGASEQMAVDYQLSSRGYNFKDYGRKKYSKAIVQMQSGMDNASDVAFRFSTEDPDTTDFEVTSIADLLDVNIGLPGQLPASETADFSFRLGNPRGVYGVLTIQRKIVGSTAIGRPKVTSIAIEATPTSRQTITQY